MVALLITAGLTKSATANTVLDFNIDFGQDYAFDTGTETILNFGDELAADIYVSVLEDTGGNAVSGLWGWSLKIEFNHLEVIDVVVNGNLWPNIIVPPTVEPNSVLVESASESFDGQTGEDLLLFSLTFECIGIGRDVLSISDKGPLTNDVITADLNVLDGQFPFELATVNNVPVPGAVWLLGSGLLGLVGIRCRKKG